MKLNMINRKSGFFILITILLGAWFAHQGFENARGICRQVGRSLTFEEKRNKLIEAINLDRDGMFLYDFKQRHRLRTNQEISEVKLDKVSNSGDAVPTLYVFPQISPNALDENGEFQNYDGAISWANVSWWYKITGYAFEFVFLDLDMTAKTSRGERIGETYDYRAWINTCGEIVRIPKQYDIG
jgi:hypothetical protein